MAIELETLGRSIKHLQYRHHRAMEAQLIQAGTTLAQWDALRAIDNNPNASAHALAVETFQTDQSFGTLANRLEQQGLIERQPGHGRRIEHRLTVKGEATLRAGHPISAEVLGASFADLSEDERKTLLDLVTRAIGSGPS